MEEQENQEAQSPKKSSKILIIFAFITSLGLGGGGYWAVTNFLHPASESHAVLSEPDLHYSADDISFIPIDPIVVSLDQGSRKHHLRFKAQLEVPHNAQKNVQKLLPRVVDIFNDFLRALQLDDVEHPAALQKIRNQLLRRAKIVLGESQVHDLLVMEFVLN